MTAEFTGKSALVVGLARSGVAAARALCELGVRVIVNDLKGREELKEKIALLEPMGVEFHLGSMPDAIVDRVDFIVISPGVPFDLPFVQKALKQGKEVISEVELAYRLCRAPVIAITGTNGKTTTTSLTGEIFRAAGRTTYIVGNIGVPFTEKVREIRPGDIVVAEVSSFQLEAIKHFHPRACAILNITEDHLNRHKTMDNYIRIKARIFENTTAQDWVVLNADDDKVAELASFTEARVIFFSRKRRLERGAWVENGNIVVDIGCGKEVICSVDEVFIPGEHNLENALAATLLSRIMGVGPNFIAATLKSFRGVEHRIELVDTIDGVTFYNDSKATNPEAAIKAVKAMKGPTVLIAGGMDKGSDFGKLFEVFGDTVTHMVVLGETAEKLIETAKERRFDNVVRVSNLKEAVEKAFKLAVPGGNVLLSPACASWDMFRDYEERGRVFKEVVKVLKGVN